MKRGLPFETLNYGRRSVMKRSYPFLKNGIYGRRSQLRSLPFDTLSYGKRGLPFETLNYGKRAYIPIDGYIMGKREERTTKDTNTYITLEGGKKRERKFILNKFFD